ncbi:MAG: RNA polymerase sigma factor [Vicinamibacterales bacterium]
MPPPESPSPTWDDAALVASCLAGDDRAWSALIAKYKNLVYSVPRKYRMSDEDAADIFQAVWIELYNDLPKLRDANSLRGWLLTVASHQAFWLKRKSVTRSQREGAPYDEELAPVAAVPDRDLVQEAEREQTLRDAIAQLSARCQEMVRLLFFEQPPLPYAQVAARLGLAVGSIGFIRGRCLQRLQKSLRDGGF